MFLGGSGHDPISGLPTNNYLFSIIIGLDGNHKTSRIFQLQNRNLYTGYYSNLVKHQDGFIFGGSILDSTHTKTISYLAKLNSLGDTAWLKEFGPELFSSAIRGISVCRNGDIIACGNYKAQGQDAKVRLMRFDSTGNLIWEKLHGFSGFNCDGFSVLEAPDGGFFVGGRTDYGTGWPSDTKPLVLTTDSLGNQPNLIVLPGGNDFYQMISHLALSPDGYLILSGSRSKNIFPYYPSMYLAKADWNGNIIWDKFIGEGQFQNPIGPIFCLPGGEIIASGLWNDTTGNSTKFLGRFSPQGDSIWIQRYSKMNGFSLSEIFDVLKVNADGGFMLCGYGRQDSVAFQDGFIMRVDSTGSINACFPLGLAGEINESEFLIYPNPANDILNFQSKGQRIAEGIIFDISGKNLLHIYPGEIQFSIPVSGFSPGIYLYKIILLDGTQRSGKWVKN